MKEREIIEKFILALDDIADAKTIDCHDFREYRENNMIVVGINDVTQVNVGLPDYEYSVEIVVNTFIDDDKDGQLFHTTCDEVRRILDEYVLEDSPLDVLFEEIPVVAMFFEDEEFQIDNENNSNRAVMHYRVIASF